MVSTSAVMLFAAEKSSISWVSLMPPMREPTMERRLGMMARAGRVAGFSGTPSNTITPSPTNAAPGIQPADAILGRRPA